jgi:hypothetical protein
MVVGISQIQYPLAQQPHRNSTFLGHLKITGMVKYWNNAFNELSQLKGVLGHS